MDQLEQDVITLKITTWKNKARNRSEWRKILEKPTPINGCQVNDDDIIFSYSFLTILCAFTTFYNSF